ncbi:MAG: hypothetical protein OEW08_14225 [Gammaproteobacteria bacterium]|nr:hypothetical protein [Gammaproteobacteria bacterium]
MSKSSNPTARGTKREILRRLERHFERTQFDYPTRVKPQRPKAILVGVAVASVLYGLTYAGAIYGWMHQFLDNNTFNKLTWITMVPSTVLGVLAWQIAKSRMEYPIRMDIRERMTLIEGKKGVIWRFQPLLDAFGPTDLAAKKVLVSAQRGEVDKIDIDDYALTVEKMYAWVDAAQKIPPTLVAEIDELFTSA